MRDGAENANGEEAGQHVGVAARGGLTACGGLREPGALVVVGAAVGDEGGEGVRAELEDEAQAAASTASAPVSRAAIKRFREVATIGGYLVSRPGG